MRDAEVVNEPGTFDLDKFRFDASVPLVTDPDNLIYLGARFGSRHYKFSQHGPRGGGTTRSTRSA
jgi:hypothetical protein